MDRSTLYLIFFLTLVSPLIADPEVHEYSDEVNEDDLSEEPQDHQQYLTREPKKHLNLEDPVEWSASGEVMDKNHAWYRRRRSPQENVKPIQSIIYLLKKKVAEDECRRKTTEVLTDSKTNIELDLHCNAFCCYVSFPPNT